MRAPLIGLPGRRRVGRDLAGVPDALGDVGLEIHFRDYARRVAGAGGLPVQLSVHTDAEAIVERLDGLVLTGGADVDPSCYGAERHPDCGPTEPDRDAYEIALLAAADARGLPVLAICRGLQLLNVQHGGTLHQHDEAHGRFDVGPETRLHDVHFEPGSVLAGLYGERVAVNTLHHQTVDRLGEGLAVTATAPDGVVEGIEVPGREIVAVQWHPEMLGVDDDPVFAWVVERAAHLALL